MKIKSSIVNSFSSIRTIALVASCVTAVAAMSSCGTARGFGSDVEKTGDKIQNAAAR